MEENQEQEELSTAEKYNQQQREIARLVNTWRPTLGDKVLVDVLWTPETSLLPECTTKGRLLGFNLDGTIQVRIYEGGGAVIPVHPQAIKQDNG